LDRKEFEIMYAVEGQHWWYAGMETITRAILKRWYRPGTNLSILDAGWGTGMAMTTYLAEYGLVTGCDISVTALDFCWLRKAKKLARASVSESITTWSNSSLASSSKTSIATSA
jgi:SAM-dependent methyltransferase